MSFAEFLAQPAVWFCFGLVAMVALLGLLLTRVALNGKIVLGLAVLFFGVITAVNLLLAQRAVSTFPGIEVSNGYIASQSFDKRRNAQENLGWTMAYRYERGQMKLVFADRDGKSVTVQDLQVLIGRATASRDDVSPEFILMPDGDYRADVALGGGVWMMKVIARDADGTLFEQRQEFLNRS